MKTKVNAGENQIIMPFDQAIHDYETVIRSKWTYKGLIPNGLTTP